MVIDISHHNGIINWVEIAKTVDSIFIKASQGQNYTDPMFIKNAIGAHTAGIKAGYYHYATLQSKTVEIDAKLEAIHFIEQVMKVALPGLGLVLDLEDPNINLSREETLTYVKTFFRYLVLNGYHDYMLYSGTHFLNDHLPINHQLGYVKLWIADYNEPHFIPIGWEGIHLLQYTNKGKIEGISGNVDLNRYI